MTEFDKDRPMTAHSSDSLLPSAPDRSEAEARCAEALRVARQFRQRVTPARLAKDEPGCAFDLLEGLMRGIGILDKGTKS